MGEQAPRQPGAEGGEDEDRRLCRRRVDAHQPGGDLGAMQGAQRPSGTRVHQVQRQQHHQQQHAGHDPVPAFVAVNGPAEQAQGGDLADAVGPAGELPGLHQQDVNDDAKAQGRHGQVVTLEAQHRPGDAIGHQAGEDQPRPQGGPGVPAIAGGEDGGAIGPQPEKGRMPQGDLPGITHQQVQPHRQDGVQGRGGTNHGDVVVAGKEQRQGDQHPRQQPPAPQTLHGRATPAPPWRARTSRWDGGRAPEAG